MISLEDKTSRAKAVFTANKQATTPVNAPKTNKNNRTTEILLDKITCLLQEIPTKDTKDRHTNVPEKTEDTKTTETGTTEIRGRGRGTDMVDTMIGTIAGTSAGTMTDLVIMIDMVPGTEKSMVGRSEDITEDLARPLEKEEGDTPVLILEKGADGTGIRGEMVVGIEITTLNTEEKKGEVQATGRGQVLDAALPPAPSPPDDLKQYSLGNGHGLLRIRIIGELVVIELRVHGLTRS